MLSTFLLGGLAFRLVQSAAPPSSASADPDGTDIDQTDPYYFHQFVTRPDIGAPKWDITLHDPQALAPGYWFVSPYAHLAQTIYPLWNGPHIYDQTGELIWSGAPKFEHQNIHDFRVSRLNNSDVLTCVFPGKDDNGNGVILDHSYNIERLVGLVGTNDHNNIHDFNLVDGGRRALMLTLNEPEETEISLPWFNGTCNVRYQGFKEVDIETGNVVYEWNDKGHIDVSESTFRPRTKGSSFEQACRMDWDITHFNSIDKCDDGNYLLSARHTDTLYKISPNGTIVWRLGGVYSDFDFRDARARFSRQHHARCRSSNSTHTVVTVFDNAIGTGQVEEPSSSMSWGLHISLRTDTHPMTADIISRFEHPSWDKSLQSQSRGSVQLLPNTNVFVGWVFQSLISEYAADGRLLMQANLRLRYNDNSYRSYKFPWVGRPSQPPDVHAVVVKGSAPRTALKTIVHVSWNGATEVASWDLLHTSFDGQYSELIASSPRQGFETQLRVDGFAKHIVAVARDAKDNELGRSEIVLAELPPELQGPHAVLSEEAWIKNAQVGPINGHLSSEESFWSNFDWITFGVAFSVVVFGLTVIFILRRRAVEKRQPFLRWREYVLGYESVASRDTVGEEEAGLSKEEDGVYR